MEYLPLEYRMPTPLIPNWNTKFRNSEAKVSYPMLPDMCDTRNKDGHEKM